MTKKNRSKGASIAFPPGTTTLPGPLVIEGKVTIKGRVRGPDQPCPEHTHFHYIDGVEVAAE